MGYKAFLEPTAEVTEGQALFEAGHLTVKILSITFLVDSTNVFL